MCGGLEAAVGPVGQVCTVELTGVCDGVHGEARGDVLGEAVLVHAEVSLVSDGVDEGDNLVCNAHGILRWAVGPVVVGGCPVW